MQTVILKRKIWLNLKKREYLKAALALMLATFASAMMLLVGLLTFFKAKNFCRLYVAPPICKLILKLYGIEVGVNKVENMVTDQCIYIANHRSVIDFFVIGSLGLKNTQYFISATNKRYWPLWTVKVMVGLFFIPTQDQPEGRTECFKSAEKVLRESGGSIFLTPEGDQIPRYKLEKFNKGAFHMATNLKIPISPFYIHVPDSVNIGRGFEAKKGVVDVYFMSPIDTTDWKVEDLEFNRSRIHQNFLEIEHALSLPQKTSPFTKPSC